MIPCFEKESEWKSSASWFIPKESRIGVLQKRVAKDKKVTHVRTKSIWVAAGSYLPCCPELVLSVPERFGVMPLCNDLIGVNPLLSLAGVPIKARWLGVWTRESRGVAPWDVRYTKITTSNRICFKNCFQDQYGKIHYGKIHWWRYPQSRFPVQDRDSPPQEGVFQGWSTLSNFGLLASRYLWRRAPKKVRVPPKDK